MADQEPIPLETPRTPGPSSVHPTPASDHGGTGLQISRSNIREPQFLNWLYEDAPLDQLKRSLAGRETLVGFLHDYKKKKIKACPGENIIRLIASVAMVDTSLPGNGQVSSTLKFDCGFDFS